MELVGVLTRKLFNIQREVEVRLGEERCRGKCGGERERERKTGERWEKGRRERGREP